MPRIFNKARPDMEGTLLSEVQEPQRELEALLERYREQGCAIEEEAPGEYTVIEKDGESVGIFLIDYN